MASQNTTLFAAQIFSADYVTTAGSEQKLPTSMDAGGILKVIADTYTTTSAITTAQNLVMCKLPIGAKVIGVRINVPASSGPTGASKIGIGTIAADGTVTVTDDDRYGTVSNINAAAGSYQAQAVTAADFDTANTTELAVVFTPVGASLSNAIAIGWVIEYVTA